MGELDLLLLILYSSFLLVSVKELCWVKNDWARNIQVAEMFVAGDQDINVCSHGSIKNRLILWVSDRKAEGGIANEDFKLRSLK